MAVGRLMALDVGKVRIGIAMTDPLGYTVQPVMTMTRKGRGEDRRNLLRLMRKHGVTEVIIGLPLNMSGEAGNWAREVQDFSEDLQQRSGLPVHLLDERLTSVAADEFLGSAGYAKRDRKHVIDQVAAVLILEGWLASQQQKAAREAWLEADGQSNNSI